MQQQEHSSTKQRKSAKGQGYTVRVEGRKVLKTSLLEEQVAAAQKAYNELLTQNQLLRAKEAMLTELLESYEAGLHQLGAVASQGDSSEASTSLISAALLDMQALQLKQTLYPAAASDSTPAGQHAQQQHSTLSTPDGPGSTATSSASRSSGQSGSMPASDVASDEGASSDNRTRVKQLLSSITPADVLSLQEITLEELAGRLRTMIGRLVLALQSASGTKQGPGTDLKQAVEDFGRLCLLSLLSDEERHCKLIGLNLETVQHVAPPEGLWEEVIRRAKLQSQQIEDIRTAHQCYEQQQAVHLQQQRETVALLQAVLSSGRAQCSCSASDLSTKPGAEAAAAVSTVAGSAHLVYGATHMQRVQDAGSSAQNVSGLAATAGTPDAPPPHTGSNQQSTAAPSGSLTGQRLQVLTDSCRSLAADSDAASSTAQGGSVLLDAAGVLTVERAEEAEQLLQELEHITRLLRQHARRLSTTFINKLTVKQHADCIVAAYPYFPNNPALCAQVAKMYPTKKAL